MLALAGLASGCKKDVDTYFTEVGGWYPTVRSATLTLPVGSGTTTSTKLAAGELFRLKFSLPSKHRPSSKS